MPDGATMKITSQIVILGAILKRGSGVILCDLLAVMPDLHVDAVARIVERVPINRWIGIPQRTQQQVTFKKHLYSGD